MRYDVKATSEFLFSILDDAKKNSGNLIYGGVVILLQATPYCQEYTDDLMEKL